MRRSSEAQRPELPERLHQAESPRGREPAVLSNDEHGLASHTSIEPITDVADMQLEAEGLMAADV